MFRKWSITKVTVSVSSILLLVLAGTVLSLRTAATAGASSPSYTLSGTLTDQNSNPIPDVSLEITDPSNNNYGDATADSSGNYSITVPAGTYNVELNGSGTSASYLGSMHYYVLRPSSANINLTTGNVTQNLQIQTAALNISVLDSSGNPVSGASVQVYDGSDGSAQLFAGDGNHGLSQLSSDVTTNSSGTATATTIVGAHYRTGYIGYSWICANVSGGYVCLNSPLTVGSGTTNITLQQPPSNTLSGTLTDQNNTPIPDVTLNITDPTNGNAGTVTTDSSGNYSMTVPPGTYNISLNGSGTSPSYLGSLHYYALEPSGADIDLTSGNVTKNLQIQTAALHITVLDSNGNPVSGSNVEVYDGQNGTAHLFSGDSGETLSQLSSNVTTNSSGTATATTIVGAQYEAGNSGYGWICASISSNDYCLNTSLTVTSGTTNITLQQPTAAPTGVTTTSPTQTPVINWSAVSGATSYTVYRNGSLVGSSTSPTYTDTSAPEGTDTYSITALNSASESAHSSTVSVVVDRTPPTITYVLSPAANSSGWNNSSVTVTFTCGDSGSGVAYCSSPSTINTNGANQMVTGTAVDNAGNSASVTATVNYDNGAPTLGTPSWSTNPITAGQSTTLTVSASEALSGVVGGEYYVGSTDPGVGHGTAMTWNGTNLASSIGSSLAPGTYTINVRAVDAAGNWSTTTTASLQVNPLPAPSSLVASSPTLAPSLSWTAVSGATSYNVYRNGTKIGSSGSTAYTDSTATPGAYTYYVTAVNSLSESSASNTVNVTVGTSPSITSATSSTGYAGTSFSFTVRATGNPTPTIKKTGTLPSGLSFTDNGNSTATISGSLSATSGGVYPLTIAAKNSSGTATQTYTITINQAPTLNTITNATATIGTAFSKLIKTKGYPSPSLSEVGTLPSGLTFVDNGDGTATLSGTAAAGTSGKYYITVDAVSSQGSDSQTFTLTVK